MRLVTLLLLSTCALARGQEAATPPPSTPPATSAPANKAPSASAPAGDVDIAKAHFNTGQVNYEHGRFEDAAREFEEAYRLSPKPPLLYNVGKSYDGANDFAHALDAYRRFLAAAPPDNPDRDFAKKRIEMLGQLVGKIALAGAVAGSAVTLDGKSAGTTPLGAPLVVNPGRHKLELAHEGFATYRSAVDVPVGGTASVAIKQTELVKVVTVTEREKEVPVYKRWWLWAAVGGAVVVAGVVTGVVVGTGSASHNGTPTVQLPEVK